MDIPYSTVCLSRADVDSSSWHILYQRYCISCRTTAYHPQGNGDCKQFNKTLLSLLTSLSPESQLHRVTKLPVLVKLYNHTIHSTMGFTTHFVLFGKYARLPVDLFLGVSPWQNRVTVDGWVHSHHRLITDTYSQVQAHLKKRQTWDLLQ